ncbi:MAG: hypothetical protein ACRDRL_03320 [Sciscionella sp.]
MSVGGVALAVAVLAITGFGWPGWLHTRGGFPVAGATRSSSTSPPENLHTAAGAAAAVAERLTAGKRASITSITCSKARSKVERVLDTFDPRFADDPENQLGAIHVTYQLRGTASRTGDQATARLIERFDNLPKKYDKPPYTTGFAGAMALHKAGDTWQLCGLRFSDSSKAPGPTH